MGRLSSANPKSMGPSCLSKGRKGWGVRWSSVTELAFKEHPTQARRQTVDRKTSSRLFPTSRGRWEGRQGEISRNVFPAPRVIGRGIEATPSEGWASLGPRSLKNRAGEKQRHSKQSGKKLTSRPGHMFTEHLLCAGVWCWPWGWVHVLPRSGLPCSAPTLGPRN